MSSYKNVFWRNKNNFATIEYCISIIYVSHTCIVEVNKLDYKPCKTTVIQLKETHNCVKILNNKLYSSDVLQTLKDM